MNEISNSNDLYTVSFDEISRAELPAHDVKVYSTITHIIRNWFIQNNKILYYNLQQYRRAGRKAIQAILSLV